MTPWIKVEHITPDKPEIISMADALGVDQDAVFGKCIRIWIWADQQTISGNAATVTSAFLDRVTNLPGFASQLIKVGWLISRNGRLCFPNFDRHNGQTAKNRALSTDRVQRFRNAPSVTKSLPEIDRDKDLKPPIAPPGGKQTRRKGNRIPEDWAPSESVLAWCDGKGFSKAEVASEAESFVAYWLGEGKTKVDWDQTFRNRMLSDYRKPVYRPQTQQVQAFHGFSEPIG